eukprot:m.43339 g.43339  ORF g.43339 m.43339 type:complete len:112 (+) comp10551_c0_seq4:769-1104(+)
MLFTRPTPTDTRTTHSRFPFLLLVGGFIGYPIMLIISTVMQATTLSNKNSSFKATWKQKKRMFNCSTTYFYLVIALMLRRETLTVVHLASYTPSLPYLHPIVVVLFSTTPC